MAFVAPRRRRRRWPARCPPAAVANRTIAAINVTPLVDVMLVLLVILMVASSYIVAQTMKVQLPKAHATDGTADKPATVQLFKNGHDPLERTADQRRRAAGEDQ